MNYFTDFVVRMHKAELVWCRFEIDVSGLVTSQEEDMIFPLTFMSMGKTDSFSKNAYFSRSILYLYVYSSTQESTRKYVS